MLGTTLPALTRAKARVASWSCEWPTNADRIGPGADVGAADTTAWWSNTTRMTKDEARRSAKLAEALDFAHAPVRDALDTGDLLVDYDAKALRLLGRKVLDVLAPEVRRRTRTPDPGGTGGERPPSAGRAGSASDRVETKASSQV